MTFGNIPKGKAVIIRPLVNSIQSTVADVTVQKIVQTEMHEFTIKPINPLLVPIKIETPTATFQPIHRGIAAKVVVKPIPAEITTSEGVQITENVKPIWDSNLGSVPRISKPAVIRGTKGQGEALPPVNPYLIKIEKL